MIKRMKASDVASGRQYLIRGEKTTFEEAFPSVKSVAVEVAETDYGIPLKTRTYYKDSLGECIDCSNQRCYGGGFDLGAILRDMIENRITNRETTEFCQGYEGSPKGRKNYGPCGRRFVVKVKITYKRRSPERR